MVYVSSLQLILKIVLLPSKQLTMSIVLITYLKVNKEKEKEMELFFLELARESLKEPGCLSFKVTRARGANKSFMLFEEYTDIEVALKHQRSSHYKSIVIDQIVPELIKRNIFLMEGLI